MHSICVHCCADGMACLQEELSSRLADLGLPKTGNKDTLKSRLREHAAAQAGSSPQADVTPVAEPEAGLPAELTATGDLQDLLDAHDGVVIEKPALQEPQPLYLFGESNSKVGLCPQHDAQLFIGLFSMPGPSPLGMTHAL